MESTRYKSVDWTQLVAELQMVYAVYAGSGKMDAVNAADAVRALGMNPTLALINSLGGTEKPGN